MAKPQLSGSSGVHAVTQARPGGTGKAPSTDSVKATLYDRDVSPQGPSCAVGLEVNAQVQPPLLMESHARISKSKSPLGEASMKNKHAVGAGPAGGRMTSCSPKETGWAGKSVHSAQVKPTALLTSSSEVRRGLPQSYSSNEVQRDTPMGNPDEDAHVTRTIGCAMAPTKTAAGQEAASAQAVNRGHKVTMVEVPDEKDNTAFKRWLTNGSPIASPKQRKTALLTPPESPTSPTQPLPNEGVVPNNVRKKVTSPTVAMSSATSAKAVEVPLNFDKSTAKWGSWCKPFEVDWMLRAIREAQNDNAACAALAVWIHKDKGAKMTDELMTELRWGGEPTRERLYELHEPP